MSAIQGRGKLDNDETAGDLSAAKPHRHHRAIVIFLYVTSLCASWLVISSDEARQTLVGLLSTGAILATFGAALATLGNLRERDLIDRIFLNVDIFFRDIVKQETPWRRWPFLPRRARKRNIDDNFHDMDLRNPEIPLDVGSHVIKVHLPTVPDDFFDLPVIQNFLRLRRFREAAHVAWTRREKDAVNPETDMLPLDEYMAYECLFDIWRSVLGFRLARYVTHLGSGLTLSSSVMVFVYACF